MNPPGNPSRRRFLVVSALVGGALVVGFKPARTQAATGITMNAWVRIAPDGSIAIVCPRNEMGQDVYTALTMLVAEELAVDPRHVSVAQAPVDPALYGNTLLGGAQMTGGSTSTRDAWMPLREAGAAARMMLFGAAATRWKVPATECRAENGYVVHGSDRLAYGALVADAAKQPPPKQVALKPVDRFTVIGKPLPRLDGADKARGRTVFGIDVAQPGMLYAALAPCPVLGGSQLRPRHDLLHRRQEHVALGRPTAPFVRGVLIRCCGKGLLLHAQVNACAMPVEDLISVAQSQHEPAAPARLCRRSEHAVVRRTPRLRPVPAGRAPDDGSAG
jgi:hypothetical protein